MVLVVPKTIFGGLNAGDVLAGFDVRVRLGASTATSRDTIGPADYVVRGTDICLANVAPIAILSANVDSAKAGELVTFSLSGSDADVSDTVAKFNLSFGDGETMEGDFTALPMSITHKYASKGNYMARLTVTDSRGLVSSNTATKQLNIVDVTTVINGDGGTATGRFGGGALGLGLLPLLIFAARRRRIQR